MSGSPGQAEDPGDREAGPAFAELVAVVDRMVSPGGDRWLRSQTHASLVRYLIEESAEVVEAIEAPTGPDRELLREELGDLLFQVVFHARLAREAPSSSAGEGTGRPFDVTEVVRDLTRKMIRRHPHLFAESAQDGPPVPESGTEEASTPAQREAELERMTRAWDAVKRAEKPERTGAFDGIPPGLPALARAEKALNKAAKAGLVLPAALPFPGVETQDREPGEPVSPESVWAGSREAVEAEVGRSLLGLVSRSRELGVDPEKALRRATREWIAEQGCAGDGPEETGS